RGIEKFLHRAPRRFIAVGGGGGQEMHPAMDIGIFALGEVPHGVQYDARLLRAGAGVQIDQRLAIDGTRQDLEIGARLFGIESGEVLFGRVHAMALNAVSSSVRTSSRWSVFSIAAIASSRKAWSNRLRAWLSGMPRARR